MEKNCNLPAAPWFCIDFQSGRLQPDPAIFYIIVFRRYSREKTLHEILMPFKSLMGTHLCFFFLLLLYENTKVYLFHA